MLLKKSDYAEISVYYFQLTINSIINSAIGYVIFNYTLPVIKTH